MSGQRWIRFALLAFPQDFRRRQGRDLLDTYEDMLDHAAPAERSRLCRRSCWQLARAGCAERLASLKSPRRPPNPSRSSSPMDDLLHDLRNAYRSLKRRPAFAAMVMLTLAIGLGSSAAMFGVVHGVLLEPLPFEDSDRLVHIVRAFTNDPDRKAENMSLPDLHDLQKEATGLDEIAGFRRVRETWVADGDARIMVTAGVTNGLLPVFGLRPHLGRDLTLEDAILEAPPVVVIGHDFWQNQFSAKPEVLGQTLVLSGVSYEIVGVAPAGFDFPYQAQAWTPQQIDTVNDCGRSCHLFETVGRLEETTSQEVADRELDVIAAALEAQYPDSNTHKRFVTRSMKEQQVGPVRGALWMLLGAVQLVVLIAAANVANLVLVRGSRRRREMAIRAAVGAGRARLFRQLMLENLILAAGSALLAWALGHAVLRGFIALAPTNLPRLESVAIDGPVLVFTAALTLVVLMLFGLVPAWRAAAVDLRSRAQTGESQGRKSRLVLLTAEVALALMLLLGSGLLLRSFAAMTEIDLGFEPQNVTRVTMSLPKASYPEPEQVVAFSDELEKKVQATPGVEEAGVVFAGPFGTSQITSTIAPLDRPEAEPGAELSATFDSVTPGFFDALGLQPVSGRFFTSSDTRRAPLALVISETLAELYFPGKDPVGERTTLGASFSFQDSEDTVYTIIGVAPDIRAYSLTEKPRPAIYMAQAQTAIRLVNVLVRSQPGTDVIPAVREHVRALDAGLPIRSVQTQEAAIDRKLGPQRFYLSLLTGFAAIALLLSAIGLYAVIAYLVSQRTRELAVRMALGADAAAVLRLVLGDALRPTFLGIVVGLAGAFAGAHLLENLLYGITPHDAMTYLMAPLVLSVVALLATLAPAWRASRLEPRMALEEE